MSKNRKFIVSMFFAWMFSLGISCESMAASSKGIFQKTPLSGNELADGLASLETLAKFELASGLRVVIYRSVESGECDSFRQVETCPQGRLFIVRSLMKEGPDENKLWITQKRRNWKIAEQPSENHHAEQSELQKFFGVIGLELNACRPPRKKEEGQWIQERYRVRLWKNGISTQLISSATAECQQ